jgi:hypothetical protein
MTLPGISPFHAGCHAVLPGTGTTTGRLLTAFYVLAGEARTAGPKRSLTGAARAF